MISIARRFGAPRDRAAGEARHEHVGMADVGPHRPRPTDDTRCITLAVRSSSHSCRHLHRAGHRGRDEVVAQQVDDHHVLGAVLHGRRELGASAASSVGRRAAAARALDRPRLAAVALDPQEQLRRDRGDRRAARLEVRGVVARARRHQPLEQREPAVSHGTSSTCARLTSNSLAERDQALHLVAQRARARRASPRSSPSAADVGRLGRGRGAARRSRRPAASRAAPAGPTTAPTCRAAWSKAA